MAKKSLQSTRERLLDASIDLFAEHGIHWVSFQQIGSIVGISQPALYKHFKDKDDLILACAQTAAARGRDVVDKKIDPYSSAPEQLKAYLDGNLVWAQKRPNDAIMLLACHYVSVIEPPVRELIEAINQQACRRISIRIASGQREGFWKGVDREPTARAIHNMLLGEMIKMMQSPRELSLEKRINILWEMAEKMLG